MRLPYADQGYVDDDADVMAKLGNFFSGNKATPKVPEKKQETKATPKVPEKKKSKWPWEN